MAYAHKRSVFSGKLIDQGVIRNKLAHMSRMVESQQAWLEQLVYQMGHLSKAEGDRLLGGTTALAKAHCSVVMELVCKEAVQILGGIGCKLAGSFPVTMHELSVCKCSDTKGGIGSRVQRAYNEVIAVKVPGGSEEVSRLFKDKNS